MGALKELLSHSTKCKTSVAHSMGRYVVFEREVSLTHMTRKFSLKHTNALKYDENSDTNARTQTQVRARTLLHVG